jgi:archaeal type IV pilus assembly protein PilA
MRMKTQQRKAVSPVIATVILVAVAITVAVGVSYWMGGISSQYTQFEKIEIQTGYATKVPNGWDITLEVKNSGSAESTITHVFINDIPIADGTIPVTPVATDLASNIDIIGTLTAGQSATVQVFVGEGLTISGLTYLSSGTTVNIKLHSAGGMDYIKLIRLT